MSTLVVTTVQRPSERERVRAREVAGRCAAPVHERRGGLDGVLAATGACVAYVVGREREELRAAGASLHVHRGMLASRRSAGRDHPLLAAVAPRSGPDPTGILDPTLGLAQDALHLADALGVRVLGSDASAPLVCLAQSGLARLAAELPAASRISVAHGAAEAVLAARAPGSVDVVYLDAMFESPARAAPGFELLRRVAHPRPLVPSLVEAARRVARRAVVLKLPAQAPAEDLDIGGATVIDGRAVRYLRFEARPAP